MSCLLIIFQSCPNICGRIRYMSELAKIVPFYLWSPVSAIFHFIIQKSSKITVFCEKYKVGFSLMDFSIMRMFILISNIREKDKINT